MIDFACIQSGAKTFCTALFGVLLALNAYSDDGKTGELSPVVPHPRLFATAADFEAQKKLLASDPSGGRALDRLVRSAERLLGVPVLERKKTGRRLLAVSRKALDRIGRLAFAWKMTGERKYARRAISEALAVSNFSDWNPSHFLDVGEMTLAVALALDWLDDELADGERQILTRAILMKGLTQADGKTLHSGWWCNTGCNWNQVCHGGLAAGAAAIRDDHPEVAESILRRARKCLPIAMKEYAGGNFPEGVGYWEYATDYNVLLLDILERQFEGGVPELFAVPGFAGQVDYVNLMAGPTGYYFNYSDPYTKSIVRRRPMAACWYLAKRFNRPDALNASERPFLDAGFDCGRMTPFMLLWYRPAAGGSDCVPRRAVALGGSNPVAVLRDGKGRDGWYAGIKAGTPGANHGHMDIGSFVLDAGGLRWACDLGCEGYNRIEQMKGIALWNRAQKSSRWSLYRLGIEGHGTLHINAARQRVDGCAAILHAREEPVPEVALDMSDVYPEAKRALRTFRLAAGTLTVEDELEGLEPGADVVWNMNTHATPRLNGALLFLDGQGNGSPARRMKLEAFAPGAVWAAKSIENPRTKADSPNKGITRISFALKAPASGRMKIRVAMTLLEEQSGRKEGM